MCRLMEFNSIVLFMFSLDLICIKITSNYTGLQGLKALPCTVILEIQLKTRIICGLLLYVPVSLHLVMTFFYGLSDSSVFGHKETVLCSGVAR